MENTLAAFLTGGAIVALIQGGFGIIMWILNRKAKKKDDGDQNIEKRLKALEQQNANQSEALKYIMYDRIRFLGQAYIAEGKIDFDDRRILNAMHKVYHNGLNGNGDLDELMKAVNALPLKMKG